MDIFAWLVRKLVPKQHRPKMRNKTHRMGHWDLNDGDQAVDMDKPIRGAKPAADQLRPDRYAHDVKHVPVGRIPAPPERVTSDKYHPSRDPQGRHK